MRQRTACLQHVTSLHRPLRPPRLPAQGQLLMLAMQLMEGGSLASALLDRELRERLRWQAG